MEVILLKESGYDEALLGLSLNKKQPIERMIDVAERLSSKDGGHNKFLEFIALWIDVEAPIYWWKQFDTYRIGVSKQSESTMHTILKDYLNSENFEGGINEIYLKHLNRLIDLRELDELVRSLPQSFLQRRIVFTNYKSFRGMYYQRKNHKLKEWSCFLNKILLSMEHPELITKEFRDYDITDLCVIK